MLEEKVYYLAATLKLRKLRQLELKDEATENALCHFYLLAESDTQAGAIAADICRENSASFIRYLCLPHEMELSAVPKLDDHQIAFDLASRTGKGLVVSLILNEATDVCDFSAWLG